METCSSSDDAEASSCLDETRFFEADFFVEVDFFGELALLFLEVVLFFEVEGDLLGEVAFPEDGFFLADVVFFLSTLS